MEIRGRICGGTKPLTPDTGTATVCDWRETDKQTSLSARSGDTVFYNAKPATESRFVVILGALSTTSLLILTRKKKN